MITIGSAIDLGRDRTRMRDHRDAARQRDTADTILSRFFHEEPDKRWPLQVLADEVGMGKTFVSLAVAYATLNAMRSGRVPEDLEGCAPRVLIIAPSQTLRNKWQREVGEMVRRCFEEEDASDVGRWFHARVCARYEDLVGELARPHMSAPGEAVEAPHVVVTHIGALGGGKKLQHYGIKRRVLLGALFKLWGRRLPNDDRERMLRGAPEDWPSNPATLLDVEEDAWKDKLSFPGGATELVACLKLVAEREHEALEELLQQCREMGAPHKRKREELFKRLADGLNGLYARLCVARITQAFPLVIVDEAHNWKNGPRKGSNGYAGFRDWIAPWARRALLLTATPFQLRPEEMLEILKAGDAVTPSGDPERAAALRAALEKQRDEVVRTALRQSAERSKSFAKAWGRLPASATSQLRTLWTDPRLVVVRERLANMAHGAGALGAQDVRRIVEPTLADPDFADQRELLREGLELHAFNTDLSAELGQLVVRHRRRTDHRLVQVGGEYVDGEAVRSRQDRHVLHASPGMEVHGDAELPHYLLMRCLSELKGGKGRTSLGTALTGCYSTLLSSHEGHGLTRELEANPTAKAYVALLREMVDESKDVEYPKVRALVEATLRCFRAGEKTLVFCFRTHTAHRLETILKRTIQEELDARGAAVGGKPALDALRSRITRREGDLVGLGLDRLLWSLAWASASSEIALPPLSADNLRLRDEELTEVARLALRYGVDLTDEKPDRVFLFRVHEHVVARRLRSAPGALWRRVTACMSDPKWIEAPYGLDEADDEEGTDHREIVGLDAQGVHVRYSVKLPEPSDSAVAELAEQLAQRRRRAAAHDQVSILDAYVDAPSFWLGTRPQELLDGDPLAGPARTLHALHEHLLRVTRSGVEFDWRDRAMTMQALRRAILRDSILLRILPERSALDDAGWAPLLVEGLLRPLDGQRESMADRLAIFVEDLQASAGHVYNPEDARYALYDATKLRNDSSFVALVTGATEAATRERIFSGFNSPLMPDVLVCTSVGQEGIDLHRHCRHVVHYDLAWNPAVIEQRTGRVDRIGSKTFRERSVDIGGEEAFLSVGVPFLAGTYDERMYEELRLRAQMFEVLTGGDVTPDDLEGAEDGETPEGEATSLGYPTLPAVMLEDLRVRLHVWEDAGR